MDWQKLVGTSGIQDLAVDQPWFRFEEIRPGITRISEPYVNEFMQANAWLIRGSARDLLIDTGNGISSLRQAVDELAPHNLTTIATHAHADHVGSLHEFDECWAHASIADALEIADPDATLAEPSYALENMAGLKVGPPRLSGPLASARPSGYNRLAFGPKPVKITRRLAEGDIVDIGNRKFLVFHLPGHSPGCMALFDPIGKMLIAGDVIYDGPLVDDLHHSNKVHYRSSLARLLDLEVDLVIAGHADPFGGQRLNSLIADYIAGT